MFVSAAITGTDYKALVLQATDIVDLVGQTVVLKRRGKDFLGLCPFHQEKTPSFHVNPARQAFHCFGCKAGGNVIDFVMKRDRIEFIDALKQLGQKAGIEMPKYGVSKEKAGERQALFDANSAACAFFEKLLTHPQDGQAARDYLNSRGFNDESVKRFQIGLAADAWDALLRSPVVKKFTPQQLASAGLLKPRTNGDGFYDTFRNRLMFPIRDESGRVIAFGGRVMPGSEDPAKYLNSPETPIFSKSRCIFGLDLAKQRIVETRVAVVVEGYTDVIMAHQYGVSNVVSVLGTAMTPQHVDVLRRFADKIVLLFDADSAGDTATNRAVELFLTQPIEIVIASMPPDVDPDEYVMQHGAEAFEKVLASATDALDYKWKQLSRDFVSTGGGMTGQQKAVEQYLNTLADARGTGPVDTLRWGAALSRVSRLTDIPIDALNRRFKASKAPARRKEAQVRHEGEPNNLNSGGIRPISARDRAERWILGILLAEPHRWHDVQHHLHVEDFTDETRRKLADVYWSHQRDEGEPVFNEFLGQLSGPPLTELAVELIHEIEVFRDLNETLAGALEHLAQTRRLGEEKKLVAQLRRTTDSPLDEQDEVDLLKQLQQKMGSPDLRRSGK
jgi:DNA primase